MLIIYAQNHYYLYAARALCGFVGAGLMMASGQFVCQISFDQWAFNTRLSQKHILNIFSFFSFRGTLLSIFDPFMNSGIVIAFVLAKYFDYAAQAKCHLIVTILFVILFAKIPESPQHLINMQKQKVCSV